MSARSLSKPAFPLGMKFNGLGAIAKSPAACFVRKKQPSRPTLGWKGRGDTATFAGIGTKPRRIIFVPFGATSASVIVTTAILYSTLFFAPGKGGAITLLSSIPVTRPTTTMSAVATRLGSGSASAAIVPAGARCAGVSSAVNKAIPATPRRRPILERGIETSFAPVRPFGSAVLWSPTRRQEQREPRSRSPKALGGAGTGTRGLDFAIARLRIRDERVQQRARDRGHIHDGAVECRFVDLGRFIESRQLANELKRGGFDLLVGGGRVEVEQRFDVSAHRVSPRLRRSSK